jgi:hypothetical protein
MSWRARIYELIPNGWTFVGPIRERDGRWTVAVRSLVGEVISATNDELQGAFVKLGEELVIRDLPTSPPN